MRLRRLWLVFGLLSALAGPPSARAAVIYKWVDADGVVHFSDQPVPGAEKITISGSPTRGILGQSAPGSAPPADHAKPPPSRMRSTEVAIVSPAQGQTFSGSETMAAQLSMTPASREFSISWTLNGAPVSGSDGQLSFTLPDLARGDYTLAATVTDPDTGESKSAAPVTFSVLRPSLLSPQHK